MSKKSFREDDIRPQSLKEGMAAALREDLRRLEDMRSGFVHVECPACGADEPVFEFEKYTFRFDRCTKCATAYMNPRATAEILKVFYGQSKLYAFWNAHVFPASREVRREKIFRPRLERILDICSQYGISNGCLVEVGAGFGIFCELALESKRFARVIAIEPSAGLAATCRSLGVETIEDVVENVQALPVQPNIVASFETVEHLFSPETFLRSCYRLMPERAIIALTCPNYEGFDISTLSTASESLDAEHINLFNPRSLRILVDRCGFETLQCITPGEIDVDIVRNKVLEGEIDLSGQPFLQKVVVDRYEELGGDFQAFLKRHNLSSHMWIVALKPPAAKGD